MDGHSTEALALGDTALAAHDKLLGRHRAWTKESARVTADAMRASRAPRGGISFRGSMPCIRTRPVGGLTLMMAWSVDRLGRSLQDLIAFMQELRALKIDLFLHQQGLDTTTPAGKMMFQVLGSFAEYERDMIRARVNAGIARAKAQGKHCGRPPLAPELAERIREALAVPGRPGIRVIAKQFGVSPMTVQNVAR
jgi:hypothetical protein